MSARLGQAAVRFAQRVLDEPVADRPAVEVEVLVLRGRPGELGQADDAAERISASRDVERQPLLAKLVRPRREQPVLHRRRAAGRARRGRCAASLNATCGCGRASAQHHLGDVAELGGRALEELAPGGRVEEEVADFDGRADVSRRRLRVGDRAAAVVDLVGRVVRRRDAAEDARVRDRADARQRLAAEAHGADAEQVVVAEQLAGRVRRERQGSSSAGCRRRRRSRGSARGRRPRPRR